MQRSCADVNSPECAELTRGALWLILYSEIYSRMILHDFSHYLVKEEVLEFLVMVEGAL
jgi:hypothetical protein